MELESGASSGEGRAPPGVDSCADMEVTGAATAFHMQELLKHLPPLTCSSNGGHHGEESCLAPHECQPCLLHIAMGKGLARTLRRLSEPRAVPSGSHGLFLADSDKDGMLSLFQCEEGTLSPGDTRMPLARLETMPSSEEYPGAVRLEVMSSNEEYPGAVGSEAMPNIEEYPGAVRLEVMSSNEEYPGAVRLEVMSSNEEYPGAVGSEAMPNIEEYLGAVRLEVMSSNEEYPGAVRLEVMSSNEEYPGAVRLEVMSSNEEYPGSEVMPNIEEYQGAVGSVVMPSIEKYQGAVGAEVMPGSEEYPGAVRLEVMSSNEEYLEVLGSEVMPSNEEYPGAVGPEVLPSIEEYPGAVRLEVMSNNEEYSGVLGSEVMSSNEEYPGAMGPEVLPGIEEYPGAVRLEFMPSNEEYPGAVEEEGSSDSLCSLADEESQQETSPLSPNYPAPPKVPGPCEPEDLLGGVVFGAKYLGSTQLQCERHQMASTRMRQAQEAVDTVKAPDGESQPMTEVDVLVSTQRVKVLTADTQETLMDHPLQTVSYTADVGNVVVIMARRKSPRNPDQPSSQKRRPHKVLCHVFQSVDAQLIAQAIGQAFGLAYLNFLHSQGLEPERQENPRVTEQLYNADLAHFTKEENIREVITADVGRCFQGVQVYIQKGKGEMLGAAVVESGWGSLLPTVVIANLMHGGAAERSGELSIGDHVTTVNGTSLVGLPFSTCQGLIRDLKGQSEVILCIVRCPPVVTAIIQRPDTTYQLGFSVEDGVICSLVRGGIAERGGIRVGHRIIEINGQSVVATAHEKIIQTLLDATGEVHIKTMPASTYRLLTGQETPVYL